MYMSEQKAAEWIQKWIAGDPIYIPELVISMKVLAATNPELASLGIKHLRVYEDNMDGWALYSSYTVAIYTEVITNRNDPELVSIYKKAIEYEDSLAGSNPWKYRFAYNPLNILLNALSYLDANEVAAR